MNMGLKKNETSNAIQLQLDADGKPKFDAIVKQNVKGSKVSWSSPWLFSSSPSLTPYARSSIQILSIYCRKKFAKTIPACRNPPKKN